MCNEHIDSFSMSAYDSISQCKLEKMTLSEIANALEQALDQMSQDTYDADLINAYIDELNRRSPLPEMPNVNEAYEIFCQQLNELPYSNKQYPDFQFHHRHSNKHRVMKKTLLVATVSLIFMLCSMVAAQAAGIDILGSMARWTENIFSFGQIRIQSNAIESPKLTEEDQAIFAPEESYLSLQLALDKYKITEVVEPKWIPKNYVFRKVDVSSFNDPKLLVFCAEYLSDADSLNIIFMSYVDEPTMQIEKTSADVEIFEVHGTEFYILENISSNTVSWITPQFECCITGKVETQTLKRIVNSMFN